MHIALCIVHSVFLLALSFPSLPNTCLEGFWGRFWGFQIPPHKVFGSLGSLISKGGKFDDRCIRHGV